MKISSLTTCLGRIGLFHEVKLNQGRSVSSPVFSDSGIRLSNHLNGLAFATVNNCLQNLPVGVVGRDLLFDELVEAPRRSQHLVRGSNTASEDSAEEQTADRGRKNWIEERILIHLAINLRLLVGEARDGESYPVLEWTLASLNGGRLVSVLDCVVVCLNETC